MKRNRYSKALKILKSTEVNEKLSALDESLPTNHTKGLYSLNDPGFRVGQKDPQKIYYPDADGNWPAGIPGTPGELEYVRPEGYWSGGSDWETQVSTDFSQDYLSSDPTGRSTDKLIGEDGTVFSGLPPGGEGFILGPIVDGFVPNHGYDSYTNIGYIQKDTRQFVLLARIQGQWKADLNGSYSTWNGTSTGFTSYNQNFTLEMAQWVRDKILADAYVSKVPYFYSGGVPQRPQSPADCPNCPPGMYGGNGIDPRQFGSGGNPSIGSQQGNPKSGDAKDAGYPWGKGDNKKKDKEKTYESEWGYKDKDGKWHPRKLSDEEKKNMTWEERMEHKYGPTLSKEKEYDDKKREQYEKEAGSVPPNWSGSPEEWRDYKAGGGDAAVRDGKKYEDVVKQGRENREKTGEISPLDKALGIGGQSSSAATFSAYKNGGGDAAVRNGKSAQDVINQGITNIDKTNSGPRRTSTSMSDFSSPAEFSAYKAGGGDAAVKQGMTRNQVIQQGIQNIDKTDSGPRPQFNYTDYVNSLPPEVKNDMIKGGKTASPVGDLAIMLGVGAAIYGGGAVAAGVAAAGARGTLSAISAAQGIDLLRSMSGDANTPKDLSLQLASKLVGSIISGLPQEIKLSTQAKMDQIKNLNLSGFEKALEIGKAPKPDAKNAVNPGNKRDDVLGGGWGDQGGVEVHYDPKTDSLTITGNKMLRTGEKGDAFDGNRQTEFGDIPKLTPSQVEQGLERYGLKEPLKKLFDSIPDNVPASERQRIYNEVTSASINYAAQGTASNAVAVRQAMVNAGIVPESETEKTGGGYGQVYSQTTYSGKEIPPEVRSIINKKVGVKESYNLTNKQRKLLKEIKKPVVVPELPKKYKMNFAGKYSPQNTPDKTASKLSDDLVASGNARGQRWRTQDKYWQGYETTERMNIIYDRVGHGDQYWEEIIKENKRKNNWKTREMQEHLNIMAHEKAMKEGNPNYESPFYKEFIQEQETIEADKDPLFKKIAKKLKKEIDYSDKPSKTGVPNEPPPQMVNGYHPNFGKRKDYYNKLDPQSASAMPETGDPEIDTQVKAARKKPK